MAKKKTPQPAPQSKFLKGFIKEAGTVDTGFARYGVPITDSPKGDVGSNTYAYVPTTHPLNKLKGMRSDTVYVNQAGVERGMARGKLGERGANYILNHEMSHVQQHQFDERMGDTKNYDAAFIDAYMQAAKNRGKAITRDGARHDIKYWLRSTAARKDNGALLKGIKGDSTNTYYDMLRKGELDLREQVADLHAAERMSYKRLRDNPDAVKYLFNGNEAMMDAYDAMTGYRLDRYDARDLPPATPVKPIEKSLFGGFKQMMGWE